MNKTIGPPSKSRDLSATSHDHHQEELVRSDPITYSSPRLTADSSQQQSKQRSPITTRTAVASVPSSANKQSTDSHKQQRTDSDTQQSTSSHKQQSTDSKSKKTTTVKASKQGSISSTVHSGSVMQPGHRSIGKKLKPRHSSDIESSVDRFDTHRLLSDTSADTVSGVSADTMGGGIVARRDPSREQPKALLGDTCEPDSGTAGPSQQKVRVSDVP